MMANEFKFDCPHHDVHTHLTNERRVQIEINVPNYEH